MSKNISKYLHTQMDKEAGIAHSQKRTKIVATVGPACDTYDNLLSLVKAGVNVFRLNFSHGTLEDKKNVIEKIRKIIKFEPYNISILADLQGPKLRVGDLIDGKIILKDREELILTTEKMIGTSKKIYVSYPHLTTDVKVDERIFLDDGKMELKVKEILNDKEILVSITLGGILTPRKGVNLPDSGLTMPSLTEKDLADLTFIIEQKLDWVALSFVRKAIDIIELKKLIKEKNSKIKVIAKIEMPEALKNLRDIIIESDGVMIARGDLGVEIPIEQVPVIQKDNTMSYPFLIERTPYSAGPYGDTSYPNRIGINMSLLQEKYIFVNQDVRGRYMSEGVNLEVTPHIANKKGKKDVDESSDTFDTIEWLIKNIKNNNGRAGIYGISYPGFYATASLPGAHPALKAVSPQAPVTDEFIGDDANHNGAFFLMDNFNFMNYFGKPRKGPVKNYESQVFKVNYPDAYSFFLKMGPLKNSQSENYFNKSSYIWNEYLQHDTYNSYWKSRNIRQHLKNISIPTLVVGGWFDAENLFGALRTYEAIVNQSPVNNARLVMGPWTHGSWAGSDWSAFAGQDFGSNTSKFFQDSLETPFFNYYLKNKGTFKASKATIFETGSNLWKSYPTWPPANTKAISYYFNINNKLSNQPEKASGSFDEYISDPKKPVPYTNGIYPRRNNEYMAEDQRFASMRPDVVVYETEELTKDITLSGKILADLYVSITGTDADFILKLIDVLPDNELSNKAMSRGTQLGGSQRLVRAEVMRGKFRNSFEKPEPFEPGKTTNIKFSLNDVAHNFKKGHKIMVQIQSSWFPLVDRNPQKFIRIPEANEIDFQKATIKIYHDALNPSKIILPVLINN